LGTAALQGLPDDARLWIFGADRSLVDEEVATLRSRLVPFLESWTAHNSRLTAGVEVVDGRFVIIALDESRVPASGCSIDALSSELRTLEALLDVRLLDANPIWYRHPTGSIEALDRSSFRERAAAGQITQDTPVFDLTVQRLGDYRSGRWTGPARDHWHTRLLPG
jgi:hypothetical protein